MIDIPLLTAELCLWKFSKVCRKKYHITGCPVVL